MISVIGTALNPIGTAQAFPVGGAMGGSMGMGASGGVAGGAVGQQENDFGLDTTQQSSKQRIANGLEQTLRKPPPLVMSASILFAMAANYYKGDSLTQQDLLEIAEMGGTAPTRLRVGFASTDETAVAMAAASQLIALHTESDSDKAQVPVIKGQLASDAERMEVISLPAYQSLGHALSRLAPIEVYRFDVDGGTQLYMGVAGSGDIINISARIDDIPKGPIIHAGSSSLPQKVEKPEGFAIHDFDYRPETLPIADDGIVWRHTGHDVEPVDFRDYILTVERKDVKPTYVSLRGKSVEEKLKARGYDDVIINENGGLDYSKSKALYHNPDRLKPDGTPVEPIVKIKYTGNYPDDFEAANMAGFGQKSTPMLDGERYLWHHLDDYDPITNEGTMQLVVSDSHNGIQHKGGVSQFKDTNNVSEYPFRLPYK